MSASVDNITGRVILVAELEAQPDKISEVETALVTIKANALSDAEPGCSTFRVSKFGAKFVVFEEYEDAAAFRFHIASSQFQALASAIPGIAVGAPKLTFYEECKV